MSWSWFGLFGAGLATFLSPCVLPLVPILVATWVIPGSSAQARIRSTLWFASGFVITFVALGAGAATISAFVSPFKSVLLFLGAGILALFALKMMKIIQPTRTWFAWMEKGLHIPDYSRRAPRGIQGLLFGMIFGLSWTPCVGPILGGVLTYVASQQSSPARGALMLFVFSLGIAIPLVGVAALLERLKPALAKLRSWLPRIEYATGVGLLIFSISLFNQARLSTAVLAKSASITAQNHHGEPVNFGRSESKQIHMVFFYSENCPICHAMERFLPEFEKDCASQDFKFSKINVDLAKNSAAAQHFNVRAVPTISILNDQGNEIVHLVGYQSELTLRQAAGSTVGSFCFDSTKKPDPQTQIFQPDPNSPACEVGQTC